MTSIMWFRQDLRLTDNAALVSLNNTIAVYVLDSREKLGSASKRWLRKVLRAMPWINVYEGESVEILTRLARDHKVEKVVWNEDYEPWRRKIDSEVGTSLERLGIAHEVFQSNLLWHPKNILKPDGTPYKVYTQFYKKCLTHHIREVVPESNPSWIKLHDALSPEDLDVKLGSDELGEIWQDSAQERLQKFLQKGIYGYKIDRNCPSKDNVSRLSPYLHFGEVSPLEVWYAANQQNNLPKLDLDHFLSELGWREFSYYLLYWFPELPEKNFQPKFDNFPWGHDPEKLRAWQEGRTGYPIVDAGMRQLLKEGYIHNRIRMVVASFLVKNLFIHWHYGRDWFWEHLYDADLANNSASWQWVAGSGADAAPYYRIFNPILQAEKFDPEGTYIQKYLPELLPLPAKYLSSPWMSPEEIRKKIDYPEPIVECDQTRKMALEAYKKLSGT